jgi:hypothetical protein
MYFFYEKNMILQEKYNPLPEVNFLMVEIPTPKPYIFMIRVTRQIKCLIAQVRGVIPLVTLIINIYGLGVGISIIKKFTSGRGWGMTTRASAIRYFIHLL